MTRDISWWIADQGEDAETSYEVRRMRALPLWVLSLLSFLHASTLVAAVVVPGLLGAYVVPLLLGLKGLAYGVVGFGSFLILLKLSSVLLPRLLGVLRLTWIEQAGFEAARRRAMLAVQQIERADTSKNVKKARQRVTGLRRYGNRGAELGDRLLARIGQGNMDRESE